MINKHVKKLILPVVLIFIIQNTIINNQSKAQLSLITAGNTETINFTEFTGGGFSPTPAPGQLDSKTWSATGFSDGDSGFDSTKTTGDFARGASNGGVTTGGIYAFDVGGDTIIGVQPVATDFTPGSFILKIQNNTGSPVMQLDVSYEIWAYNDQDRANSLNFSYSSDNLTYTNAPGLDFTTIQAADSSAVWTMTNRSITITDTIANNDFFYLRWTGDDISGANSRDEYGIDDIQVTGFPALWADFSFANACLGNLTCFTDQSIATGSTIVQWLWDFGDGNNDTVQNPCHIYPDTGNYVVTLIVIDDSSNADTASMTLNVYPAPVAGFLGDSSICLGGQALFTDTSTISTGAIVSWYWHFDDPFDSSSTSQNPFHIFSDTGLHNVQLIVTSDNGCTDTITQQVEVYPAPVIDTSLMVIDSSNCGMSDGSVTGITVSGGTPPLTYQWVDDSLTVVGGDSANLIDVPSGSYTLTVTGTNGCSATSGPHIIVDIGMPPAPAAPSPPPYCEGDTIAGLTATGTGGILIWYSDAALSDSVFSGSPFASGATTDTSFWVTETLAGCRGPATQVNITVNPTLAAAGFTSSPTGLTVFFTDASVGAVTTWNWNFGDGIGTATIQNPAYMYSSSGTYNVCLTTNVSTCPDTYCDSVTVVGTGIMEQNLKSIISVFPNPANNGIIYVDFGNVVFDNVQLTVYNILGETMEQREISRQGKQVINLSGFAKGLYFLYFRAENFFVVKKIISF